MSNLLKFKQLLDDYKEGKELPEVVLAYKYKESPFGELALGYLPLFSIDISDYSYYLHKYEYLLDSEKRREVEYLKNEIDRIESEIHDRSSKLDAINKEIYKIKESIE